MAGAGDRVVERVDSGLHSTNARASPFSEGFVHVRGMKPSDGRICSKASQGALAQHSCCMRWASHVLGVGCAG